MSQFVNMQGNRVQQSQQMHSQSSMMVQQVTTQTNVHGAGGEGDPNGQTVDRSELAVLRSLVLGEVGTFVTLGFERQDQDGDNYAYEVSLMRGNADYFAQLKQKNMVQEEVERLRRQLGLSEEELERLRKALKMAEGQGTRDKEALGRLRGLLSSAEDQLKTVQTTLNQEMMERRVIETRIQAVKAQSEQDANDLGRLRNLLNQADEKLAAANQSLEVTRRQKNEQEARYREEQAKKQAAEGREKQLVLQMEERMDKDRRFREQQEQQLLALEEERRNYEKLLREEQNATENEKRRREGIEARTAKTEHTRDTIAQDNERLLHMLKEAEDARVTIEQARVETEQKNRQIESEVASLVEQGNRRQRYIDELKEKLEQERVRWEAMLRTEQEGRKDDNNRYKSREEELISEMQTLNVEMRHFKETTEEKRRQLETNVMRLESEGKSVDAALKAEESLAEALRERLGVLADQISKAEDDVAAVRNEKSQAQHKNQSAETGKLRALERERAMDVELQTQRDQEQEKIDAIENMKLQLHVERMAKERQLHEEKATARDFISAKQEAEHVLRRAQDEGQRMVDNERRRLERELKFRKTHEETISKFEGSWLQVQGEFSSVLTGIHIPVKEFEQYAETDFIFDDTAPRMARDVLDTPPVVMPTGPGPQVSVLSFPARYSVEPPTVQYFHHGGPPPQMMQGGPYQGSPTKGIPAQFQQSGPYFTGRAISPGPGLARRSVSPGPQISSYMMQQQSQSQNSYYSMSRSVDAASFRR